MTYKIAVAALLVLLGIEVFYLATMAQEWYMQTHGAYDPYITESTEVVNGN